MTHSLGKYYENIFDLFYVVWFVVKYNMMYVISYSRLARDVFFFFLIGQNNKIIITFPHVWHKMNKSVQF